MKNEKLIVNKEKRKENREWGMGFLFVVCLYFQPDYFS